MELIGIYLIGSALLVCAGVAKVLEPADTARALSEALPGHLRLQRAVRLGAAVEAAIGLVALVLPRPIPAALVCISYASFAAYVAYVRQRHGALSSCGCFGRADTPATWLHVAVNLFLAVAAAGVALTATEGATVWSVLAAEPWSGLPLVLASAVGLWLTYQALALLPSLGAARHQLTSTHP